MSRGATIEKYEYNHRCCATSSYVLAAVGTSSELALSSSDAYSDAMGGVSGNDVVLSEQHTACDPVLGLPRVRVSVERLPEECGSMHMGKLSPAGMLTPVTPTYSPFINPDVDILATFTHPGYPATNTEHGRVQVEAMWYDELDRLNKVANFGSGQFPSTIYESEYAPGLKGFTDSGLVLCQEYKYRPGDPDVMPDVLGFPTKREKDGPILWAKIYRPEGMPGRTVNPLGIPSDTEYDDAGRPIKKWDGRCAGAACETPDSWTADPCDFERWLETFYDGDRILSIVEYREAVVQSSPPSDLVVTYHYPDTLGSVTPPSGLPAAELIDNDLPVAIEYPPSTAASNRYWFRANRQGQTTAHIDPAGNQFSMTYDAAGRLSSRSVSAASGFNSAVQRQEFEYDALGRAKEFAQFNAQSAGAVTDAFKVDRDGWGNITSTRLDPDSDFSGSGVTDYGVDHTWERIPDPTTSEWNGWQRLRRTSTTLPGGLDLVPTFGGTCTTNSIDNLIGRVTKLGAEFTANVPTDVAIYGATPPASISRTDWGGDAGYFGIYIPGRTRLPQPSLVEPRVYHPDPGHPDIIEGLDNFNRPTDERWFKPKAIGEMPDAAWQKYEWDPAGRVIGITDVSFPNQHYKFGHGCNNELIWAAQGSAPGAPPPYVSNPPLAGPSNMWSEAWGKNATDGAGGVEDDTADLDRSGNLSKHWYDSNGDGDYADTGDFRSQGTFSAINEADSYSVRDGIAANPTTYTRVHDANGNLITDDKDHYFEYDPWGRLVKAYRRTAGVKGTLFAEFTYNALGFRMSAVYDLNGIDGDMSNDIKELYAYDEQWRLAAVFKQGVVSGGNRPAPVLYEQYVYHAAGFNDGRGIKNDSPMLCRRDTSGDGVPDVTLYFMTNTRGDVTAVTDVNGKPYFRLRYSAYGVPYVLRVRDHNADYILNSQDFYDFMTDYNAGHRRADVNLDGSVTSQDFFDFMTDYNATDNAGRGHASTDANGPGSGPVGNRFGFAGYWWDEHLEIYHVRNRAYNPYDGKWMQRDPIGMAGGWNLYAYCGGNPITYTDPWGLTKYYLRNGGPIYNVKTGAWYDGDGNFLYYGDASGNFGRGTEGGWFWNETWQSAPWMEYDASSDTVYMVYKEYNQSRFGSATTVREVRIPLNGVSRADLNDPSSETINDIILQARMFHERWKNVAMNEIRGQMQDAVLTAGVVAVVKGGPAIARGVRRGLAQRPASRTYLTDSPEDGWKVGDPINNRTARGNEPSWDAVRARYWKNEAKYHPERYSDADLARMKQGDAPRRYNPDTGKWESMECHHHPIPQRDGGKYEFSPMWPDEHEHVDRFRQTGR